MPNYSGVSHKAPPIESLHLPIVPSGDHALNTQIFWEQLLQTAVMTKEITYANFQYHSMDSLE